MSTYFVIDAVGCLHCSMGDCLLLLWQHKGWKNSKRTVFFRQAVLTLPLFQNHRLSWDILMVFSHGLSLEYFFETFALSHMEENLTLSNRSASFKNWTLRNKSDVIILKDLWLCSCSCNTVCSREACRNRQALLASYCWEGRTPVSLKAPRRGTSTSLAWTGLAGQQWGNNTVCGPKSRKLTQEEHHTRRSSSKLQATFSLAGYWHVAL